MNADYSVQNNEHDRQSTDADPILAIARERFGITALAPLQRFVIANTLEKLDQLVVLPTGAGKSVCFQLPALFLNGITLVVVPLLSLLQDQQRRLAGTGVPVEIIRGEQTQAERSQKFTRLLNRSSRILFATPEILENDSVIARLKDTGIGHFVIDEAHCISEWGKTFRPAYRGLGQIIQKLGAPMVSAFTATASPQIVKDIADQIFQDRPWKMVDDLPDRPTIFYRVIPALCKNALLARLAETLAKPLVVFCRSRKSAELSATLLRRRLGSQEVFFYHAGLYAAERRKVEEWFFSTKSGILCSTSAYGMGVDKPDIRSVVHTDVPPSVEAYLQESGRAGRDGNPAEAVLLHGYEDGGFLNSLTDPVAQKRFSLMYDYATNAATCRRRYLLGALDRKLPECAGCDVCGQELICDREGEAEIISVITRSPRRYSKRELIALLAGQPSFQVFKNRLDLKRGFGALKRWEREDIEEAVEILVERGLIAAPERGLFKYRYRVGKNRIV